MLDEKKQFDWPLDQPVGAVQLLKLAVADLAKAAQHIDPQYKALALYERSKSLYHIARLAQRTIRIERLA
jgi:hypothetical protein